MNSKISNQFGRIKEYFHNNQLVFVGVFGSYARGTQSEESDLDILFEDTQIFKEKYKGLKRVQQLETIRKNLEKELNIKIDLVNKKTLGDIGKKYILRDVVYV